MAKIKESSEATPARPPPSKKQSSSAASDKNQRSILGFFSKAAPNNAKLVLNSGQKSNILTNGNAKSNSSEPPQKTPFPKARTQNITPVPSSDAAQPPSSQDESIQNEPNEVVKSFPSLPTPAGSNSMQVGMVKYVTDFGSPSRKV
jgi:DNA mismatch repair protein MSH6